MSLFIKMFDVLRSPWSFIYISVLKDGMTHVWTAHTLFVIKVFESVEKLIFVAVFVMPEPCALLWRPLFIT